MSRIVCWARADGAGHCQAGPGHPRDATSSRAGLPLPGASSDSATATGAERVEAACHRAVAVPALSYRSVESILNTGLTASPAGRAAGPRPPPPPDLRGADYYR